MIVSGMQCVPVPNPIGVGEFKTVDRLIVIADNANRGLAAKVVQDILLRSVEVLVFIDEDMREFMAFGSAWICVQILV
jgi:hypothetical protein